MGIGLPLGVYLTNVVGFEVLFVLAAVASLAGLAALPGMPQRSTEAGEEQHVKVLGGLRGSGLLMPTLVFAAVTVAAGISVTFLPLAAHSHAVVAVALLIQSITAPAARWLAGRLGDRIGPAKLLAAGSGARRSGCRFADLHRQPGGRHRQARPSSASASAPPRI